MKQEIEGRMDELISDLIKAHHCCDYLAAAEAASDYAALVEALKLLS